MPEQPDETTADASATPTTATDSDHPVDRRGFGKAVAAIVIGGLITLTPLVAGLLFFLDPLIRRWRGDSVEEDFIKVDATVDSLPDNGLPMRVTVFADKVDAWNKRLNQPIGSVYLSRQPDGSVVAFNVLCPHLGCTVDYRPAQEDYFCPCHTSSFNLSGEKTNAIPPRGMDTLEVKTEGNSILVKYQEFLAATQEKIPV